MNRELLRGGLLTPCEHYRYIYYKSYLLELCSPTAIDRGHHLFPETSPRISIADQVADDAAEFEDATQSAFGQILVFWDIPNDRCGSVVLAAGGGDFSKSNENHIWEFVMGFDGM